MKVSSIKSGLVICQRFCVLAKVFEGKTQNKENRTVCPLAVRRRNWKTSVSVWARGPKLKLKTPLKTLIFQLLHGVDRMLRHHRVFSRPSSGTKADAWTPLAPNPSTPPPPAATMGRCCCSFGSHRMCHMRRCAQLVGCACLCVCVREASAIVVDLR